MQSWALTDRGCVRSQNQDTYKVEELDRHTLLCVVCDGMGGAKSGNVASAMAAEVFVNDVKQSWTPGMTKEKMSQILQSAVKLANATVYEQSVLFDEFQGMGTTLVAALIQGKQVTVVNVGDSRAYKIDQDGIRQITKDHSLVQLMVDRGELTPEVARTYPGKNFITRAVGTEPGVLTDVFQFEVEKDDCLFLCTDGLSNMIDEQEILFEVAHGVNKALCCQRMLEIVTGRGAPDNVTSALIMI